MKKLVEVLYIHYIVLKYIILPGIVYISFNYGKVFVHIGIYIINKLV